jgi:hypothetical protein
MSDMEQLRQLEQKGMEARHRRDRQALQLVLAQSTVCSKAANHPNYKQEPER